MVCCCVLCVVVVVVVCLCKRSVAVLCVFCCVLLCGVWCVVWEYGTAEEDLNERVGRMAQLI